MSTSTPGIAQHPMPYADDSPAARLADWIASLLVRATRGAGASQLPEPSADSAELLRRADEYEPTQPSYAADLRAAAALQR